MGPIVWSKNNHKRFGYKDRQIVRLLLLIQRRTRFIQKDVLIYELLPRLLILCIPTIYVSNFDLTTTEEDLVKIFKKPLEYCKIARRRNNRSKGFGFIKCMNYDDSYAILKLEQFVYGHRMIYVKETL